MLNYEDIFRKNIIYMVIIKQIKGENMETNLSLTLDLIKEM